MKWVFSTFCCVRVLEFEGVKLWLPLFIVQNQEVEFSLSLGLTARPRRPPIRRSIFVLAQQPHATACASQNFLYSLALIFLFNSFWAFVYSPPLDLDRTPSCPPTPKFRSLSTIPRADCLILGSACHFSHFVNFWVFVWVTTTTIDRSPSRRPNPEVQPPSIAVTLSCVGY